jgi:hypothetical protein
LLLIGMTPSVAIVIPVGPGDTAWRALLPQLEASGAWQIALVLTAGEPEDPYPLSSNVTVVRASTGRAAQLNAGAAAIGADWLWFVHADCRVDASTLAAASGLVAADVAAIGYFDLRFLDDGPRLTALNTVGANLRSRLLGLPFGDQGLLMSRRVFLALGGFDERLSSGEDHALAWTARKAGIPLRRLAAPIYTSARKYAQHGWLQTTLRHVLLTGQQAWHFSRARESR